MEAVAQLLALGAEVRAAALGGRDLEDWTDQAAVVGLVEVLKHYRYFRDKLDETIPDRHPIRFGRRLTQRPR